MRGVQSCCFFEAREVGGGGAKENFRDQETDIVAVCGKSDVHLNGNMVALAVRMTL